MYIFMGKHSNCCPITIIGTHNLFIMALKQQNLRQVCLKFCYYLQLRKEPAIIFRFWNHVTELHTFAYITSSIVNKSSTLVIVKFFYCIMTWILIIKENKFKLLICLSLLLTLAKWWKLLYSEQFSCLTYLSWTTTVSFMYHREGERELSVKGIISDNQTYDSWTYKVQNRQIMIIEAPIDKQELFSKQNIFTLP